MKPASSGVRTTFALATLVLVFSSCRAPDSASPGEAPASESQAISDGTAADATGNPVVLIVHPVTVVPSAISRAVQECSGTMLTPRLVLTARHCVARAQSVIDCATSATTTSTVSADFDPATIFVFGGKERPAVLDLASASHGIHVIDDAASTLCNHDLALVVLDSPVLGSAFAPIRLDAPPRAGELVTLVGWGVTSAGTTASILQQRSDVEVVEVGPATALGAAEFVIGDGPCEGDSGGPALAADGAVIGALSRGDQASSGCTSAGGKNLYTSAAGFKDLILSAYAEAGQEPWLDGQPNPLLAATGAPCRADGDCQSNDCTTSTRTCAASAASTASDATTMATSGGCTMAPRQAARRAALPAGLVALLALLALRALRALRASRSVPPSPALF